MNHTLVTTTAYVVSAFTLSCSGITAQNVFGLNDCLARVREAHPATEQVLLTQSLQDLQVRANNAAYLPQLQLNGKASWQSDITEFDLTLPGIDFPTPSKDQYAFTAELVQSVYDGGTTRARKNLIASETELSALQFRLGIQNTEEAATSLFFQIRLQQHILASHDLLLDQLSLVRTRLNHLLNAGITDKGAILETDIRLSEVRQQRAEALERMRQAKSSLSLLMQTDTSAFTIGTDDLANVDLGTGTFDGRVETQLLDAQIRQNTAQDMLNRSLYHPRLSLFATAGYGNPGLNFLNDAFDTYAIVGASISIPLSQVYSGKASREKQAFEVRRQILDESRVNVHRDLELKSRQYNTQIEMLGKWLEEDALIVTQREQLLTIADARLEGGTITPADYLDAVIDLSLAQEQRMTHTILLKMNQALLHQLYTSPNIENQ